MELSKRTVVIIVVMIAVALSGLIVLQTILLRSAMISKEQALRRNVLAALSVVSQRMAASEMVQSAFTATITDTVRQGVAIFRTEMDSCPDSVKLERIKRLGIDTMQIPRVNIDSLGVRYTLAFPQQVTISIVNPATGEVRTVVDTFNSAGEHLVTLPEEGRDQGTFFWDVEIDGDKTVVRVQDGETDGMMPIMADSSRHIMVASVLHRLETFEQKPINERIDSTTLDSALHESFVQAGIELEYGYGVLTGADDSLVIAMPLEDSALLRQSALRTQLFPADIIASRATLSVYFPGQQLYLWRQMSPLLVPSILFIIIITACFAYTIRTILVQKRFAGLVVGFINNMTHEFKTPISTIQLACEAISRPDIRTDQQKTLKFNRMIQDESRRMKLQTDKILQLATLEQGDYELQTSDVDIHDLIEKAVETVALHVAHRQGKVNTELNATRHIMRADAVHIANVIHNLLDNANKYSPDTPIISIATRNYDNGLLVEIADNGPGIPTEYRKMVFDKYFRVPSGDVHDVKGFGLGLSYVKLMVEAHGGSVALNSDSTGGTRIELFFPAAVLATREQI